MYSRHLLLAATLSFILQVGCVGGSPWTSGEVVFGLSQLVLEPEQTCDQLREKYQLTHLPQADVPSDVGMEYEEVWLPVNGDTYIRTWYITTELDRGTVVVSCGNSGPMACYLFTADLLTDNGWSVVMYEYEGFGLSTGQASLGSLYRDLDTVVEWTRERTGREQVTLFGISLGSIPSVAFGVERPDAVNGVILDSPIAFAAQVERFGFVLGGRTDWILDQLDPTLLPDVLITELEQPLLVFLHGLDPIATPETVELLYDLAPGEKQLVRFGNLGHSRGQFFSTDVYLYYLEQYLARLWTPVAEDDQPATGVAP